MYKIVTHPGSAHKDDFLATTVLLATLGDAEVFRREPTQADLDDPDTRVAAVHYAELATRYAETSERLD